MRNTGGKLAGMDLIYWTSRVGLVLLWVVLALGAWSLRQTDPLWKIVTYIAIGLATIRAFLWNWLLVGLGSQVLHAYDLYDDRVWAKLAMFIVVASTAVLLCRWYLRTAASASGPLRVCLALVMLMAVLVFIFPVEEVVPLFLYEQPGRYMLEFAIASAALAAVCVTRRRANR